MLFIKKKKKISREHHENILANQKPTCPQIIRVMAENRKFIQQLHSRETLAIPSFPVHIISHLQA